MSDKPEILYDVTVEGGKYRFIYDTDGNGSAFRYNQIWPPAERGMIGNKAFMALVAEVDRLQKLEKHPYAIGKYTMQRVFKPTGMKNMSDMQAVLDAVEKAVSPSDDIKPTILYFIETAFRAGFEAGTEDAGVRDVEKAWEKYKAT